MVIMPPAFSQLSTCNWLLPQLTGLYDRIDVTTEHEFVPQLAVETSKAIN